ncbi:MAG: TonB-dependent receptor [Pseudomonas sp.]
MIACPYTKKNYRISLLASALAAGFMTSAMDVRAQEKNSTDDSGNTNAARVKTIDSITITARKRSEDPQKVADATTVITKDAIENSDIRTVQDAARLVPNLVILDHLYPGIKTVSFRGFTTLGRGGEFPFSTIVDGVVQPGQMFFDQDLLNVQQIEILRGPQGTLYGGGAIAGAINIVTAPPSDKFEGSLKMGSYGGATNTGTVNLSIPLVKDKLYARIAAYGINSDGMIDNTANEKNADYVYERTYRGSLLFTPTDKLSIRLNANYTSGDHGALWLVEVPDALFDGYVGKLSEDQAGKLHRRLKNYSLKADYDITDSVRLTSISATNNALERTTADGDYTAESLKTQLINYREDSWSQELRLASINNSRLHWNVGLYYQDYKTDNDTYYGPVSDPQVWTSHVHDRLHYKTSAIFGQASYEITDKIEGLVGFRHDSEDQELHDTIYQTWQTQSFSVNQPKATLSYKFTPDVFGYLSYARGYRKGGFNAREPDSVASFKPETADNFELGIKSKMLNHDVMLNADIFKTNYKNQQFSTSRVTSDGIYTAISNIEKTDVYGAEFEGTWLMTDTLSLNASTGYTHAEIKKFVSGNEGSYIGNVVPQVYGLTAQVGVDYRKWLGNYLLAGHVDLSHRGKVYWDVANELKTSPSNFLNARISVEHDAWSFALVGRNLTDERVPAAVGAHSLGTTSLVSYNLPRQYGVELGLSF